MIIRKVKVYLSPTSSRGGTLVVILFNTMQNLKISTLEILEKVYWLPIDSDENSFLIRNCHSLRKKQLSDFSIEDLRIMIGQNIGLKIFVANCYRKTK